MRKFTGYLQPGNYDIFKYLAAQAGVLDEDRDFAWASGRFQVECYKEEIEANMRTPGLAGFQLLDLHDYLGQGTALIGVLDTFWEPKSYITAAEYRRFAGPTVPLARLARRTFTSDQTLEVGRGNLPLWRADARRRNTLLENRGRKSQSGRWRPLGRT